MSDSIQPIPQKPGAPLVIRLIGVGGAGGNVTEYLSKQELHGVEFWVVNTDARALANNQVKKQYQLGAELTHGFSAGGDVELGWVAAEKEAAQLAQLCVGANIVFIVAGMGGGTGTGAAPVIARLAKENGALVVGFAIMPFVCEGPKRQHQAGQGLELFKLACDGVICLPNERMLKLINENTTVLSSLRVSNELLAQGLRGIWRLITQPGIISVDFGSLCEVIRGKHAESSFATAEAAGSHRAREVVEKLLANPLLEMGQILQESDAVLVSVVGGSDLTMSEVNRALELLGRQCESAHILLGAALDPAMGDRMEITVIASSHKEDRVMEKTAPATEPVPGQPTDRLLSQNEASMENLVDIKKKHRHKPRYLPPPPELSQEQAVQAMMPQKGMARLRKIIPRLRQAQFPFEIISKGRFEKSEPTVHQGEDLDVPTYIRRGVPLN